jgi:NADH dehydrogenase
MKAKRSNRRNGTLVLGGSGFIGRHVVAALCARGGRVVIGSRHPARIEQRLSRDLRTCERRKVRFEDAEAPADWRKLLEGIDVVINCVGILRPRGRETYERIHHVAPAALATACRELGCRLIHVSALGLAAPVRSRFLTSKRAGEKAIRASEADWYIVRPSLLDGDGGFGAKWLRRIARWPVHPVPVDSAGRVAVLDVRDLGEALARLALDSEYAVTDPDDREFDLGGLQLCTLAGHLAALRRVHTSHIAWQLPIPGMLARIGSHLCDLLHFSPYSFGHWELLGRDNCPERNRLPELLGRMPRAVYQAVGADAPVRLKGIAGGRITTLEPDL